MLDYCHRISKAHGFWKEENGKVSRNIPEALMLIVSELAEAMEAHRKGDMVEFNEELADVAIRLFDLCGGLGVNLEQEIDEKMKINVKRPFKHGKDY